MRQGRAQALGWGVGIAALGGALALAAKRGMRRPKHALRDYSSRSGFPRPAREMRGLARR